MWSNYIKIAFRSLAKNKLFTSINVLGLTVGMAATLLIYIWVQNEWTFDGYHQDSDRIHRIICHWNGAGEVINIDAIPIRLKVAAEEKISEIEEFYILKPAFDQPLIKPGNGKVLVEKEMAYVNEAWLEAFDYKVLEGSVASFNADKYSMAITTDQAQRYFGDQQAIGQTVELYGKPFTVRLLLENNPSNSSFQFKTLLPMAATWNDQAAYEQDFNSGNYNYVAFFKGPENMDEARVASQLSDLLNEAEEESQNSCSLIALKEMRFNQTILSDYFKHQDKSTVYIFAIIGLILLLTAGLNYVNLSTALISKRVKEIGVKKVIGAGFKHIFAQVITETLLISLFAFSLAIGLVQLLLPALGNFVEIPLLLDLTKPTIWVTLIGVIVVSVLIAGIYPALLSAGFQPMQLLQTRQSAQKGVSLRKVLVVTQFTAVIIVLISTLVIYQQLQFIQQKDVGYDRTQVIKMRPNLFRSGDFRKNFDQFVLYSKELEKLPEFKAVTTTDNAVSDINNRNSGSLNWEGKPEDQSVNVAQLRANASLLSVFDLKMTKGRWFDQELSTDQNNIILNEEAVKRFNIPEPVIGRKASFQRREGTIIGVVKNFNFASLHEAIEPLVIWHNDNRGNTILAKLESSKPQIALNKAQAKFEEMLPDVQFDYSFIDENFRQMHENEAKMGSLFQLFAGLLGFISCLGLLGLTVFSAELRVKEIGVRKVLGASVANIVSLLTKDFLKLVLLALLLAVPIAWYLSDAWLQNFAFRTAMPWWVFMLAGFMALGLAFLTVSVQSLRAALANPVDSLRNE